PATPILPDLAAGAVAAGLLAGWLVWALRFPYLGLDGSTYHLSTVAEWVRQGTTGHSLDVYVRVPVGSYPLTWEPSLAWAVGLALAAGGVWYLRNLIAHGSPGWPFVSTWWGDPVPPLFDRVNFSLLDRPGATLEGQWATYRVALSGGIVLVAGGLLAPLWAR